MTKPTARSDNQNKNPNSKPVVDGVVLDSKDNVATSLRALVSGREVRVNSPAGELKVKLSGDIPPGHKFALKDIKTNEYVVKFGEVIGIASNSIDKGEHVHTQNLATLHGRGTISRES